MTLAGGARRVFAVVPAAGRGERFAPTAATPKQYAPLAGRTMIEWSIAPLLANPRIDAIVVVVAAGDSHWRAVEARLGAGRLSSATGGATRHASV